LNTVVSIAKKYLPYVQCLDSRSLDSIDLVVIHCTELPDLAAARQFGQCVHYKESGTGNSGHFYVERNGNVEQWVPLKKVAHHVRDHNERSVGIELVNLGRYPNWLDSRNQIMKEPYPPDQIDALLELLQNLLQRLPALKKISGHSTLDTTKVAASNQADRLVFRKQDPGPRFPWEDILAQVSLDWFEPGPTHGSDKN